LRSDPADTIALYGLNLTSYFAFGVFYFGTDNSDVWQTDECGLEDTVESAQESAARGQIRPETLRPPPLTISH
jgi:hypothetical protein